MRPYEVMTIYDVGADPQAIAAVVDRTVETIRTTGGNPGTVDRWGRRPFAYEVNHKREGYYVLIDFTAEPTTVAELDRMLALADEVVRHKVIRLPEKVAGRARPAREQPAAKAPEQPAPAAEAEETGSGEDATTDATAPVG
jgi:small subunit ribosomal protein S6